MKNFLLPLPLYVVLASQSALATNYSPQNALTGVTSSVQSSANYGKGVVFGDIDTGVTYQWVGFTPQYNGQGVSNINTSLSAVCLNGVCPTGAFPTDQNGHGTFTASEMVGAIPSVGFSGVAPGASLIAVQVLSASGSGMSNDVANGIVYAVNHGAQVLNLSLGPSGSASQQAAFYQSLGSALNYAASKNAVVVFAGGNAAQNFDAGGNITGLTDAALTHMFFMGSTNASEIKSSFSNKPGTGYFVSTTGKHYAYENMWMMADGENIWGASNYHTTQYGYSYVTQMSGTSMAAPQGAGVAGLLAARWPFLLTQGTIPAILEQTAQDLGTKGVDSTYGDGFLRADLAMQAVGTLTVPTSTSKAVPIAHAQIISGGATGSMSHVAAAFSNAVAYDSFHRDFPINPSSLIVSKGSLTGGSVAVGSVTGQTGAAARTITHFGEDGWAAFSGSIPTTYDTSTGNWSWGYSQGATYVGAGQGTGAALSFSDARWGGDSAFFNNGNGASGALLGLAPTANFASAGMGVTPTARVAMTMFSTQGADQQSGLNGINDTSASGAAVAYTFSPSEHWKLSLTSSFVNENNMMLGSVSSGFLGLPSGSTFSVGMGSAVDLGEGYKVGFDAALATTRPGSNSSSLINSTSQLDSMSFSLAFAKDNLTGADDGLHLSVDKPLRVYSGSASLSVPVGTDMSGNPIISRQRASLTPDGNETDVTLGYTRPLYESISSRFDLSFRNDADNVSGAHDAAAMMHLGLSF